MSNAENKAFFDAAREGRLMIGQCKACKQVHYYPRAVCPFCASEATLVPAKGTGKIYSYSVMRRVEKPFAIASHTALTDSTTAFPAPATKAA